MNEWQTEAEKARDKREYIETLKWRIQHGYLKQADFDQALKNWENGVI